MGPKGKDYNEDMGGGGKGEDCNEDMGGEAPLSDFWWVEFLCPSKLSSSPLH